MTKNNNCDQTTQAYTVYLVFVFKRLLKFVRWINMRDVSACNKFAGDQNKKKSFPF